MPRLKTSLSGLHGAVLRSLVAALLVFCATADATSQDRQACAVSENFANPEMLAAMRRGVNLPGWDHPDESRRPTLAQLQALRDKGFSHIRLPLDHDSLSGDGREAYLDRMFEQIVFLLSLDYAISLDLHAGGIIGPMSGRRPLEAQKYLTDVWRAIASRVRSFDPKKLAVELLNEPETDPQEWWKAAADLIVDIRRILPSTTIVVGPAGPQRHEMLSGLKPLDDDNIVYAIHYYDPFAFTHQGADWGGPDDPIQYLRGLPFPADASAKAMQDKIAELNAAGHQHAARGLAEALDTPWSEAAMAPAFDTMRDWSVRYARPVIVNEFGVLSHFAPRRSRLDWLAAVRRQAEKRCFGWTHWDFQDGFGLIDPETRMPDAGIMQALVPDAD